MFKKDAEKYRSDLLQGLIDKIRQGYNCKELSDIELAFQKGADCGYNRANEWHKQDTDDIYDLISKDYGIKYFICIMKDKKRLTAMGYCDEDLNGGVSAYLDFDHDDDKYYIDDIVWWKEIILPKG